MSGSGAQISHYDLHLQDRSGYMPLLSLFEVVFSAVARISLARSRRDEGHLPQDGGRTGLSRDGPLSHPRPRPARKSALIPIDSWLSPRERASSRDPAKARPDLLAGGRGEADRHEAPDVQAGVGGVADERRHLLRGRHRGGEPPSASFTSTRTAAPGHRFASASAPAGRVEALPEVHVRGQPGQLVALQLAEEVPAHAGGSGTDLAQQFLGVVLADVVQPAPAAAPIRHRAEAFGDRDDGDRARGALRPGRCAP